MEIRAFDGSLRGARGILEVDRATFGDCHYTPEYIAALESDPRQHAWVAQEDGQILGFVSAFATYSLAASRWEVDELAVHPQAQGRGIGTSLVARALAEGARYADLAEARALVAVGNVPSQRVFSKGGFSPVAKVRLILYRVTGRTPRPRRAKLPLVRSGRTRDAQAIARLSGSAAGRVAARLRCPDNLYLVAEPDRDVRGYAELIHVRTLQYEGLWIESLAVDSPSDGIASALFNAAIEEAKRCDTIDEVGYLASPEASGLRAAGISEGFREVDEYLIYVRTL